MPVPQPVTLLSDTPLGVVTVDCVLTEDHSFSSEVSAYPVEDGATTSDNIYNKPPVITLTPFVTNTPLVQQTKQAFDAVQTVYELLLLLRAQKKTLTLVTSLARYPNMAIADLSIPVDGKTGSSMKFTARFQQIETTTSQSVILPNLRPGKVADQGATKDGGKQSTKDKDSDKLESYAHKLKTAGKSLVQSYFPGTFGP